MLSSAAAAEIAKSAARVDAAGVDRDFELNDYLLPSFTREDTGSRIALRFRAYLAIGSIPRATARS
jgi:hypothetical protein